MVMSTQKFHAACRTTAVVRFLHARKRHRSQALLSRSRGSTDEGAWHFQGQRGKSRTKKTRAPRRQEAGPTDLLAAKRRPMTMPRRTRGRDRDREKCAIENRSALASAAPGTRKYCKGLGEPLGRRGVYQGWVK